ncbi:MAG: tetratricopeptide repeat protein [Deltaproteobacteria bacterium]|nr:MAG: tetratricopeptide repeat protein [Deltaproteobacteria bacterium]
MKLARHGIIAVTALVWVSALASCEGDLFDTSEGSVDDGNEALLAGKVDDALKSYAEAVAAIPESPQLNYDRGLAESLAGHHEEATQLLLKALDTREKPLMQKVRAALGVAYSRWGVALERTAPAPPAVMPGTDPAAAPPDERSPQAEALDKWTVAVKHLEEALRLDPSDAASLHNLEVALLRVDPPCSSRDDSHEDNDTRGAAALIEPKAEEDPAQAQSGGTPRAPEMARDVLKWTEQLHSCPDDPDWYKIELQEGDRLSGELTVPAEPGATLALEVVGPDGEVLHPGLAEDGTASTRFDLSGTPAKAGTYYLRVDNVKLDETSYGLEVKVRPACWAVEDRFEDNDTPADAVLLTPGPLDALKLCPNDSDWYAVDLAEGESLFLYAQESQGAGDEDEAAKKPEEGPTVPPFSTEIHGADGALLAKGAPTGKGRVTTLLTPGPGRYLVRLVGDADYEGRYDLNVQVVPPCPEGDDRFEDNDVAPDAVDIAQAAQAEQQAAAAQANGGQAPPQPAQASGPPTVFARICPGDVDWFSYTEQGDKPSVVSAVFEHAKGDLALELYDETGVTLVARADASTPEQNGEAVALPPREKQEDDAAQAPPGSTAPAPEDDAEPPPRTFKIKVSAAPDAENFYLLQVQQPSPSSGGDSQDPSDSKDEDDKEQDQNKDDQQQDKDQGKQDDEQKDEQKPQEEAKNAPLQDALDKLDRNPENLEATESARKSPLANRRPGKDW